MDFDIAKIEAMRVEVDECRHCQGTGQVFNGFIYRHCPKCYGTGETVREMEGVKE